jgi:hypothetical protein
MDHYAKAYSIISKIQGYRRIDPMLVNLRGFGESEVTHQRIRVMNFYEVY